MLSALYTCFRLSHTICQYSSVFDLLKQQFCLVQPNTRWLPKQQMRKWKQTSAYGRAEANRRTVGRNQLSDNQQVATVAAGPQWLGAKAGVSIPTHLRGFQQMAPSLYASHQAF